MKNVNQSFDGNLQKVNLISWNANVQQQRICFKIQQLVYPKDILQSNQKHKLS